MTEKRVDEMTKEELIRELRKLEIAARRTAAKSGEPDREQLIQSLHVHEVELEMQNRELQDAQERVEAAVSRYSDLYDFAPVGYCTLDPKGRVIEINLTGAALLGAPRERLVGGLFVSIAPLADRSAFLAHVRRCTEQPSRVTSEVVFARGDRGTRVVQLVSDPVRDQGGAIVAYRTILVDISDIKALEERLRLLSDAGQRLAGSLDVSAALETAARIAVPAVADLCMVDVRTDSGTVTRSHVLFADPSKQSALAAQMIDFTPRPGWQTPQARVIESGEPMLLSEVTAEQRDRIAYDDRHADVLRAAGIRSLMVVPLSARGRTFGCLTLVAAESDRHYSTLDLRFAQDIANRAAMALDNSRLHDETLRANEQLRVSEAKSSGIVSVAADAIISVDDGHCIALWNDGAEHIFGFSRAEAIGAPVDMLTPERLRVEYRDALERFAHGDETARRLGEREASVVGLRKNGEEFPADTAASKLTVGDQTILTVAIRDMTAQKRVEGEQRFLAEAANVLASTLEYEETLTNIVNLVVREFADFAVLYIVEEGGHVRRARAASREPSMSLDRDVLLDLHLDAGPDHVASRVVASMTPMVSEVTPAMLGSLAHTEEHRRALEAANFKSMIAVPLMVAATCVGALVLESSTRVYEATDLRLADDIARRMALNIENAALHRAAQRAIQARDDVLAIVAHDLRNPLGTILMEVGTLRMGEAGPQRSIEESTAAIQRSANRMKRLIRDLLDVTRMESSTLSMERFRFSVVATVADFARTQAAVASSASLELRLDVPADAGEVFADRDRFLQVLENLVSNAERFTPAGGKITIGAAPKADEVVFWVSDTGAGIPADVVPHLFDRFSHERKIDRMGTGLGLPIVKGIVEAHGGRVWVESTPGAGTKVSFAIPRALSEAGKKSGVKPSRARVQ